MILGITPEELAENKYPMPKVFCRIKREAILEKRRLYIERLNAEFNSNKEAANQR